MYRKGHIHFIGIGGIGMSGLAKILKTQGYAISGCDVDLEQKSIRELIDLGCQIYKGNNTPECQNNNADVLVYSSAIKGRNPEIIAAQEKGIPTIARALMLAELMRVKYSIAITGAHGKTTTTSIISHILLEAEKDPTVIIGGHLHSICTNARLGSGDFLVAEADESDRSFLKLYPTLAVVTNIDLEHLETYNDLDDIKQAFRNFLTNIPFYGKAFVCIDDANLKSILPISEIKTVKYGLSKEADIYADNIKMEPTYSIFDVFKKENSTPIATIKLNLPGAHNIQNALAAIAVCFDLEIEIEKIAHAISTFQGVDRRFTFRGTYKGAEIIDDYGHHPTEIKNTLKIAKNRAKNKLRVVFQPHRFIRTYRLWNDFIKTFIDHPADSLIITDIYPAGELPIDGVHSAILAQEIKNINPSLNVHYVPMTGNFKEIIEKLNLELEPDDLILTLGAGRLNKLSEALTIQIENNLTE